MAPASNQGLSAELEARARATGKLAARIGANSAQRIDLGEWVFERLRFPADAKVLELCCGTGAQTRLFAERLGPSAMIAALDASPDAIETIRTEIVPAASARVEPFVAELDSFERELEQRNLTGPFDVVFCAYGLYYAKDPRAVLDRCSRLLTPSGRIVIVGPHGANNVPLYEVLGRGGVEIPRAVLDTSVDFMREVVLGWAELRDVRSVEIHMMRNPVEWDSSEAVLEYWRNSTFYCKKREQFVAEHLQQHFMENDRFINVKCVMSMTISTDLDTGA